MNRKLKRAITFYLISCITMIAPIMASIVMAIIGVTHWNWEGRAALAVLGGLVLSASLFGVFLCLIDDHESDIRDWINEPEQEKTAPKAGAWKEKD